MVARENFFDGEKLCLRSRDPRRVVRVLKDYVLDVEDLRNHSTEDVHGTRLMYYADSLVNEKFIPSHVLSSESCMPESRLLRLQEYASWDLCVIVRCTGLTPTDNTLEEIQRGHEYVPKLLRKLLDRRKTPSDLRTKSHVVLGL